MTLVGPYFSTFSRPPPVVALAQFLLDPQANPGAVFAYSFFKLRTAYTGSAVRIRRSSDNAEIDVGFNNDGSFDTTTAASHIGGGSGFIVTWYDQSGRGFDVTQATSGNQPTYVASGIGGNPCADFDGTNDKLTNTTLFIDLYYYLQSTVEAFSVFNEDVDVSGIRYDTIISWGWGGPANIFAHFTRGTNFLAFSFGDSTATGYTEVSPFDWHAVPNIFETAQDSNSLATITLNGVRQTNNNTAGAHMTVTAPAFISIADQLFAGLIGEVVVWPTAPFGMLLDDYPSAAFAYSLRKLRHDYQGSAARIRRSSDNAEIDVGFDAAGNFDTVTAASHIGGGSGFVVRWYDQSGNAYDVSQSTSGSQPPYAAAGINSKPCLSWDGTRSLQSVTDAVRGGSATAASTFAVATLATTSDTSGRLMDFIGTGLTPDWDNSNSFDIARDAGNQQIMSESNNTFTGFVPVTYDVPFRFASILKSSDTLTAYLNGVSVSSNPANALSLPNGTVNIGVDAVGDNWGGYIGEVVGWFSDQGAARLGIDASQRAAWGF